MRQLVLLLICTLFTTLPRASIAIQFSANAVMSTPGSADVLTHLYYSSGRIRKEFMYFGEPVIQILDATKQSSLMCFTEQKLCYENTSLEQIHIGIENTSKTPCENNKSLVCENQGEQQVNQRQVIKWKISTKTTKKEQKPEVSYLWLDKEFNIPVKQILFNKTTVELNWLGHDQLNDRSTDKWIQKIKYEEGSEQESFQWFDRELKISIREAYSNGNSRELKHIVVENLPDSLFTMPEGYAKRKMKMPEEKIKKSKSSKKTKKP